MSVLRRGVRRWEMFWFEDVPSDVFVLVRIAVGVAGLISVLGFLPVDVFWSPMGIAPIPGGGHGIRGMLVQHGLGDAAGLALFLTLIVSFTCMTLGLFTSASVAACFLGCVLQSHWNSLPLTSGHTVLVAVLFALVWADCGGRPSLDSRRGKPAGPDHQAVWPLRLIQIQIALVYASSGLFKLLGYTWRDGSAIHFTTTQNVYARIFDVYTFPASLDWTLTLLTYSTLCWELTFPLLMLNRTTRKLALLMGIGVHLGIWLLMEVGPFSWMMLASYVAFLDPRWAARFMVRHITGDRTTLAGANARRGLRPVTSSWPAA
jgi:hypothetical protein